MEVWLLVLIAAVVVNSVVRWKLWQEARVIQRETRLVLSILVVWAETWGDPPEVVRERLHEELKGRA